MSQQPWEQALSIRAMQPPVEPAYRGPYLEDGKRLLGFISDAMREWGVTRAEINGDRRQGHRPSRYARAARCQLFRDCYRAGLRPLYVAKFIGCEVRTVVHYYTECAKRFGPRKPRVAKAAKEVA